MIKLKNVTKKFGDITALSDVSFEVDKGEFVFITGPSGAGKTTILKLILREVLPDNGKVIFDGIDVTEASKKEIPQIRQKIGVVFQDFKVLPERTLRENVEVALAVSGIPQSEWPSRVDKILELVGLSKRSELFPSQLSGGELERVSLARALVVNPKLILADEPTGNLDSKSGKIIMEILQRLNEDEKRTIILVTHETYTAEHAQRIIHILDGEIDKDYEVKKIRKASEDFEK